MTEKSQWCFASFIWSSFYLSFNKTKQNNYVVLTRVIISHSMLSSCDTGRSVRSLSFSFQVTSDSVNLRSVVIAVLCGGFLVLSSLTSSFPYMNIERWGGRQHCLMLSTWTHGWVGQSRTEARDQKYITADRNNLLSTSGPERNRFCLARVGSVIIARLRASFLFLQDSRTNWKSLCQILLIKNISNVMDFSFIGMYTDDDVKRDRASLTQTQHPAIVIASKKKSSAVVPVSPLRFFTQSVDTWNALNVINNHCQFMGYVHLSNFYKPIQTCTWASTWLAYASVWFLLGCLPLPRVALEVVGVGFSSSLCSCLWWWSLARPYRACWPWARSG